MTELTSKQFNDLIYDKLNELGDEITLDNPTTESKFPCRTLGTPLEAVLKTENAVPILKQFQISISHWNQKQRECMDMANKTDNKLREYNMIRTNTCIISYDDITKKYRLITSYEVKWNGLFNAFQYIK